MAEYDFKSLSPIDFEILTRDLLQQELKVRFESFKAGRDGGIDLRYSIDVTNNIVVQCKHYVVSGFSSLKAIMKNEELDKIKKLNPRRYILSTSVSLGVQQKEEIKRILLPYIKDNSDIIGQTDINNLLGRHPNIERSTIKLWATNATVLEEVLHASIKNNSRIEKDRLQEHAKIYVNNESFAKAMKILNENNFCIIAGQPGIGKTILAEMLALYFCKRDFELIKVSFDIQEALAFIHGEAKRIYFYDDFLGQISYFEKLHKNEDQRLLDFINAIRKTKGSKLILTTREYILNQAKYQSEKLGREDFDGQKCIVDLESYTRRIRAEILFNHLYFSTLPDPIINALLRDKAYLKIIDHRNYNPRIIQLMTEPKRLEGLQPGNYIKILTEHLDKPIMVWDYAFKKHLSQFARNMLIVMFSMPKEVDFDELKLAFENYHSSYSKRFSLPIGPNDALNALKELEGDFVAIKMVSGHRLVAYCNPSVNDFVHHYLVDSPIEQDLLVENIIYFDQLRKLWEEMGGNAGQATFKRYAARHVEAFKECISRCMESPSCNIRTYYRADGRITSVTANTLEQRLILLVKITDQIHLLKDYFITKLRELDTRISKRRADKHWLLVLLKQLPSLKGISSSQMQRLYENAKLYYLGDVAFPEDLVYLGELMTTFPEMFNDKDRGDAKIFAVKIANEAVSVCRENEPEQIRNDIEALMKAEKTIEVEISRQLEDMERHATDIEEERGEDDYYDEEEHGSLSKHDDDISDPEIESMFATLKK